MFEELKNADLTQRLEIVIQKENLIIHNDIEVTPQLRNHQNHYILA